MSFLPSDKYKNKIILYNDFNNDLMRGINQGLTLYSPDKDLTLYKSIDTKDLEKLNFDQINKDLNINIDIDNNVKSFVSGLVSGTGEGIKKVLGLDIDTKTLATYLGLFLLAIIIFKKI